MADKLPQNKEEWDAHIRKNREKREKEARDRRDAAEKRAAESAWKQAGNDPKEFEASWPKIRRERQEARAMEEMDRARRGASDVTIRSF